MFGLSQLATQVIGILLAILLLVGGYYYWKHTVKTEALSEWNKQQVEVVLKEQQKLTENLAAVTLNQTKILGELNAQRQVMDEKFKDLETYLNSQETKKTYEGKKSTDVLKRTFKEISK